jgi:hypothetical protein
MGHFASLAQKSMDCFVLVTAPFRFTSGGARAPPKHSATWKDKSSEWNLLSSSLN